jgi:hypothetical protein
MKSNPLIGPVTIPRRAHRGMALLPWVQDVNRAIQQLRDRKAPAGGSGFPSDGRLPMFWVTITNAPVSPATAYEIRVEPGLIAETLTITDNKPITRHHPVPAEPPEDPLTMTDGQVVFLTYETDKLGAYKTDTADIVVASDDAYDDTNRSYPPAPAAVEGTEGTRAVKLARLDVVSGTAEITQIWRGPWQHWQDLPTLTNKAAGDAQVYAGFDSATGKYEFRALQALAGINIVENADEINFSTDGASFNLILVETTLSATSDTPPVIEYNDLSGPFLFCIRAGLVYLPAELPEEDRDDNGGSLNPGVAGEIYDRYVFRALSPEVSSFIAAVPPPP